MSAAVSTQEFASSAKDIRNSFLSHEAQNSIIAEADAPVDAAAAFARSESELKAGNDVIEGLLQGKPLLAGPGRKQISVPTPTGPAGGPAVRTIEVVLPSVEDMSTLLAERRSRDVRFASPEVLTSSLRKFLEKCLARRADHIGMVSAWGPKPLGDAEGEFGEVMALMSQGLRATEAALASSKFGGSFQAHFPGNGREALCMPPANFALLGLKDMFLMLMQGYRVTAIVQPRFFVQFRDLQDELVACGIPQGLVEVLPGITPEADPEVLHEALRSVDRVQFTGSSAMFKSIISKAYDLGNLNIEHAGEISGVNKVCLDGVSASHPAVQSGTSWATMANNGELCTSASVVEFDPSTGDNPEIVKEALESHPFKLGRDPSDPSIHVLLKDGKTDALKVITDQTTELREWWEKTIMAVPRGGPINARTNQSLGLCVFSPSIDRSVALGTKEDASNVYLVGVNGEKEPSAWAGTTGAKVPESVFGGMKSYTHAVAGDHDGVGTLQTILTTVKSTELGNSSLNLKESQITDAAKALLGFLPDEEQSVVKKQVAGVLELFEVFEPTFAPHYPGKPLVNGEGRGSMISLPVMKPVRKNVLLNNSVGLSKDLVRLAVLTEVSPLQEHPVDMHVVGDVTETQLAEFANIAEEKLGWKMHRHSTESDFAAYVRKAEYPPYFFCSENRSTLPVELLKATISNGGYHYEGLPKDVMSLFRAMTTTQAWTVSCTPGEVDEAKASLKKSWASTCMRSS